MTFLYRCIFNASDKTLELDDGLFKSLQQKDLVMNIFMDDKWGSFRHFPIENSKWIFNWTKIFKNSLTCWKLSWQFESISLDWLFSFFLSTQIVRLLLELSLQELTT